MKRNYIWKVVIQGEKFIFGKKLYKLWHYFKALTISFNDYFTPIYKGLQINIGCRTYKYNNTTRIYWNINTHKNVLFSQSSNSFCLKRETLFVLTVVIFAYLRSTLDYISLYLCCISSSDSAQSVYLRGLRDLSLRRCL